MLSVYCIPQLHAGGKDEVGVVLFGTPDTDNQLAQDEQYSNITTAWQLTAPSLELLLYLRGQVQPGTVSADCILSSTMLGLPLSIKKRLYPAPCVGW